MALLVNLAFAERFDDESDESEIGTDIVFESRQAFWEAMNEEYKLHDIAVTHAHTPTLSYLVMSPGGIDADFTRRV